MRCSRLGVRGAFSLAVAGLWSVLIGGHAIQARNEKPGERGSPLP